MAEDFGVNALKREWAILKANPESGRDVERAAPEVERILQNMEKGIALAKQESKTKSR